MSEAAVGVRPALSSDEWEAVAEQLIGAEDGTWRGVLRCVCRASRDGGDGAAATVQGGRRMDPRVLAARGSEGDEVEELLAKQAGLLVRGEGYTWNETTCASAAGGGNLEMLHWAREQGCPWDDATCLEAARSGNLSVLQWARTQGCPWDAYRCLWEAYVMWHVDVVGWMLDHVPHHWI